MKAFKDWMSSARPLSDNDSFFDEDPMGEDLNDQDMIRMMESEDCDRLQTLAKSAPSDMIYITSSSFASSTASSVLYRLHVATLIRAGESDLKRASLGRDRARAIAAEQEAAGQPGLDFSFRILVLGKTGVGKSATINSIFGQTKAVIGAFRPVTDCIQEVVGTVNGIKITLIDTPGLLPFSTSSLRRNRKIMLSVKRFIRRFPPDIVLYFDCLDLINRGYSDFPLLKLITDVFSSAIWFNTILVQTHSSSALPEGPNGYLVNYESFVTQCTDLIQHYIHQAVSDSRLNNPVLLVDNHPECKTNILGEKVLPNGQVWRPQFLLLCICTKVLGDVSTLLKFWDSIVMGPASGTRLPSLPHLLSSLLRPCSVSGTGQMDYEMDEIFQTWSTKMSMISCLRSETLYLKKQWKGETQRRRECMLSKDGILANDDNFDNQEASPEAVLLPDIMVPPSFDSDCPVHRYRCLITTDQWLVRPVLDPQGWDHNVGFDGINLETAVEIQRNFHTSVMGQMSKDKHDFGIQNECAAAYTDPKGLTGCVGLNVQSAGKDLVCTARGDTKLRNLKHNMIACGVSVMSFGNKYYVGTKLEDTVSIGKRVKLVMNAGRMGGLGQVAYGGSFEAALRGRDYPSDFRPGRGTRMSVNANLNSWKMGQVCIKTNTLEQVEIALIAVVSIVRALLRGRAIDDLSSN
ncbi:hypothetical protein HHK36_021383 [Tetracentron sinense]|uniref:AIG1-type G domain-containing protein n=1 Tax=Tetracentron sinense TaxID=13715 RepID=A0A834YWS0_TETSI|nr:hypothetical protein HHK36_021383 [Tetracentron sinense]